MANATCIGDLEIALKNIKIAYQLNEKNVDTLINYGLTLKNIRQFEDAIRVFERAKKLDKDNKTLDYYIGKYFLKVEKLKG